MQVAFSLAATPHTAVPKHLSDTSSLRLRGVAGAVGVAAEPTPAWSPWIGGCCTAAAALLAASAVVARPRASPVAARRGARRCIASAVTLAARGGAEAGAGDVGAVLLSGGVGKRMGAKIPKQYIKLLGLEIALHALEAFLECDFKEIVIVCAEEWRSVFEDYIAKRGSVKPVIKYTGGGAERQDSVSNGLAELTTEFIAVHDCARPLVTKAEIEKVIVDARKYGAALLGVKTKATIKKAMTSESGEPMVSSTPDRSLMWEAHTPQVIRCELLRRGFQNANEKKLAVTDDVSLVEFLGEPVKLTEGEYTNMKVTTPEDIAVAETILKSRGFVEISA